MADTESSTRGDLNDLELTEIRGLLEAVRFASYVQAVLLGLVSALLIGVIMAVILSGGLVAKVVSP
ncbi:MAG: hypothetical protein QOH90_94 [Actinomycetota bacterium]|nr:hypothetical protein [Actinomycetota bacterium]